MKYLVVVERGVMSWGAHVPDLPGCVAAAASRDEVIELIRDAVALHIDALREDGLPIPVPASTAEVVEIAN
jgi:predicted RNase H-like HicB family nuclease